MQDSAPGLIKRVVVVLESMKVPYMIGGSVALSVWAVPRSTHDLDVVVDLPEERIAEFCGHFPDERYYIDTAAMLAAFRQQESPAQGMYSFIEVHSGMKVDVFPLLQNDPAQRMALSRSARAEVLPGVIASVYSPDDLLVQKLRWYAASASERQFRDCLNLLLTDMKRPAPLIDQVYVQGWAARLGSPVQKSWERVKAASRQAVDRQD